MMLMTPSANSEAIRAQQQPTHHKPFLIPIRSEPVGPSRHEPSRAPSGLRHLPRHRSFSGVNWYTAATSSVAPATQRPVRSQASTSGATASTPARMANANAPAPAQASR